jgi:hypothetical protein
MYKTNSIEPSSLNSLKVLQTKQNKTKQNKKKAKEIPRIKVREEMER